MDTRTFVLTLALSIGCGGARTEGPPAATEARAEPSGATRVASIAPSEAALAAVADEARPDADRALDAGRRPAEVLTFFRVSPGQHVAELFAGGGYTTELLARIVGPTGSVLSENSTFVLDRFARAPLAERLARPGLEHVTPIERDLADPLPPEARDLDAVIFILAYHDTFWQEVDRAAMNRAVFRALRPGGVYGIVDHSAEVGSGARDVQTLHRVDEALVIEEVTAAGFVLEEEADVLRNDADSRDWNDSPTAAAERRGTSDRFVLRFVRPG